MIRPDLNTLAAWAAYQAANENARRAYDTPAHAAAARPTGDCHGCGEPVHGSAIYCPPCRETRRRATYTRSQNRRRQKGNPA